MKKLSYLIVLALILGLVLTGCSLLSNISQVPATEQSGVAYLTKGIVNTLFSDDFESYAIGPLMSMDWKYVSGIPSIMLDTTQVLGINGGSYVGEAVAVTGSPDWQDYSLDLDAKKCSGSYFNIVFRYVNSRTYYMVESPSASTNIALWKRVDGAFSQLVLPRPAQPTVLGTWYHYRIELRTIPDGTNIKVFVDGVERFDFTDNTPALARGSVGVGGYGSESRFDNVVVQYLYGFKGLLPPCASLEQKSFKLGRTIPLKWQYTVPAGNVIDIADADPKVEWTHTNSDTSTGTLVDEVDAPGASGLQYDAFMKTWQFNWQTKKDQEEGTYGITITSDQAESSPIFEIALRK